MHSIDHLSSAPSLGGHESFQDRGAEDAAAGIHQQQRCRFRQKYLPPTVFALETCHGCYTYMPKSHFVDGRKWWNATGPFENGKGLLSGMNLCSTKITYSTWI